MSGPRYASVLGLGFGDCGKGLCIDALTRHWKAHSVVRFNGGAQAGHNVVTDEMHHTFSQFSAGTLVPGVQTLLVDPMIVHPTALLVEAEVLSQKGVHDALSRLTIDGQCRVTTPYHQSAGRLRELARGTNAHGTCGVGVGETVRHGIEHPEQQLRYSDLTTKDLRERLQIIRETYLAEFSSGTTDEHAILRDDTIATRWLTSAVALARHCPPASNEKISKHLNEPGAVLFEGAQGVLLDEWHGFHPHTTWSSINTAAVDAVLTRFGVSAPVEHLGILRTYLTRHGAGPFPTHDKTLDAHLPEPHNIAAGWQGRFRRGHPDAVLLGYALQAVGSLSGLCVTHLDAFDRGLALKWCGCYSNIDRLPLGASHDLIYQSSLAQLLQAARPKYASKAISSAKQFIQRLGDVTALPIALCSYGPTHRHVGEAFVNA